MALVPNTDISFVFHDEIIAYIAFLFLYLTYYFGSDFPVVKRYLTRYQETPDNLEESVYVRRTMGFVLLGVIPLLVVLLWFEHPLTAYGIGLPKGDYAIWWTVIPIVVIGLGSSLRSSAKIDISYYPEVRKDSWTTRRTIVNAGYWALYLLGYEFAIRGMLFFASLYAFGLWPAIMLTSVIYSLIHIFKGSGEAYGAFFLGILFCLITYYTQSIWPVFINHVLLAVINDIKAVQKTNNTDTPSVNQP